MNGIAITIAVCLLPLVIAACVMAKDGADDGNALIWVIPAYIVIALSAFGVFGSVSIAAYIFAGIVFVIGFIGIVWEYRKMLKEQEKETTKLRKQLEKSKKNKGGKK